LEISRISRNFAALLGFIAGVIACYWGVSAAPEHQALGWVFPILYAIIAYGVVSMLVLLATADLSIKSEPHHTETHAHDDAHAGGHGSGHH
jgi:ABC-type transport system involved in cytochrome c biogenesis permease subunit